MNAAYSPGCTPFSTYLQVVKQTIKTDAITTCHEHLSLGLRSSGRAKDDYSINTSDVRPQIAAIQENQIFDSCGKGISCLLVPVRDQAELAISEVQHLEPGDRSFVSQSQGIVASYLARAATLDLDNHQIHYITANMNAITTIRQDS